VSEWVGQPLSMARRRADVARRVHRGERSRLDRLARVLADKSTSVRTFP
jgi:hypothetical protein